MLLKRELRSVRSKTNTPFLFFIFFYSVLLFAKTLFFLKKKKKKEKQCIAGTRFKERVTVIQKWPVSCNLKPSLLGQM